MTPAGSALADLDRRQRRRLLIRSVFRISAVTAFVVLAYFVVPVGDADVDLRTVVVLVGGLVGFVVALAHQVRRIIASPMPQLRAVETLATVVPLFVVACSLIYVGLYNADPSGFSQPITKVTGLYFTVTVLATVGFGDVTATTDATRLVVTLQMLVDLLIVGVLVKVVIGASRIGIERRRAEQQAAEQRSP